MEASSQGKLVAVTQFKGGVGATTLACSLAAVWAKNGLSVVVVDLDYLANAVTNWALVPEHFRREFASLLKNRVLTGERLKQCLYHIPSNSSAEPEQRFFIFPQPDSFADSFVSVAEDGAEGLSMSEFYQELFKYLRRSFDVVVLDLTRSWGVCSLVASSMADEVLTVVDDDRYSLRLTLDTLTKLYHESGDGEEFDLKKWRLVVNGWSGLTMKRKEIEEDLQAGLPTRLGFGYSIIPFSIRGRSWGITRSTLYDLAESCVQDALKRLAYQIREFSNGAETGRIQAAIRRLSFKVVG
jgi:cellulose biosynthesis protein BcsQ